MRTTMGRKYEGILRIHKNMSKGPYVTSRMVPAGNKACHLSPVHQCHPLHNKNIPVYIGHGISPRVALSIFLSINLLGEG